MQRLEDAGGLPFPKGRGERRPTFSLSELPPEEYRLKKEPLSVSDSNSRMTLTIDARLSVTYNWDRYFVNACGQYNHFNYNDERVSGRLKDWYVNVSAGVRF